MKARLILAALAVLASGAALAEPAADYEFLPLALDPGMGEFPEGITIDRRGNLYYSLAPRGEIWRATPGGKRTLLAVLDPSLPAGANGALGLAAGRGEIYAALMACDAGGCNGTHGVWRIRNGRKSHLRGTENIAFPNALAVGRHGELYVSDSLTGAIWVVPRTRHGKGPAGPFSLPEIWIQDEALLGTGALGLGAPIGANGIVYSRGRTAVEDELLVANTERGSVLAIGVTRRGRAGDIDVLANDPSLVTIDGIAEDRSGHILALTVGRLGTAGLEPVSQLLQVRRDSGEIRVLLTGAPLHFSTSLALGTRNRTGDTLFVTNWAVLAPAFGMPPQPGLVRIDVEHASFVVNEP